jgi:hypothetical protein
MELLGINGMIILPIKQTFKIGKKDRFYTGHSYGLDKEIATSGSRQLGAW